MLTILCYPVGPGKNLKQIFWPFCNANKKESPITAIHALVGTISRLFISIFSVQVCRGVEEEEAAARTRSWSGRVESPSEPRKIEGAKWPSKKPRILNSLSRSREPKRKEANNWTLAKHTLWLYSPSKFCRREMHSTS